MATTINPNDVQRGDAFWYDFPPSGDSRYEHLIRGRHRVVVIQNNGISHSPRHDRVIVCPISSTTRKHINDDGTVRRPFQALLEPKDCIGAEPLTHSSVVHLEEMYTLSKADCTERLFQITSDALRKIDSAIIVQLDLANQLTAAALDALETDARRISGEFNQNMREAVTGFVQKVREATRTED